MPLMWGKIFKSSADHSRIFIKNQKWALLMLFVVTFFTSRWFESLAVLSQDDSSRIIQQFSLSLISMLEAFFVLLLFVYSKRPTEPTWGQVWLYVNESVRVLTRVLLWMLALIIPAFFVYLRYVLMPYVVFFDPDYREGKVDALARSRELVKGLMPALVGLAILFIGLELTFELIPNLFPILQPWPIRILFAAGGFLLNIYSTVFCFVLFETRRSQLT